MPDSRVLASCPGLSCTLYLLPWSDFLAPQVDFLQNQVILAHYVHLSTLNTV